MKDFNTYQTESRKTWDIIPMDHPVVYPTMGLVNEAGEVAGKIKKIFRDQNGQITEADKQSLKNELGDVLWYQNGQITEADKQSLKNELGDVLWYLTQVRTELGLTLEEVAETNITKIFSRQEGGKLGGDGDNR